MLEISNSYSQACVEKSKRIVGGKFIRTRFTVG